MGKDVKLGTFDEEIKNGMLPDEWRLLYNEREERLSKIDVNIFPEDLFLD